MLSSHIPTLKVWSGRHGKESDPTWKPRGSSQGQFNCGIGINLGTYLNVSTDALFCWGIQRARVEHDFEYSRGLENTITSELDKALEQEELLWRQKSRETWLHAGDWNTKFFHLSTIIRKRRNRICKLKDEIGNWCEDDHQLREMIVLFYKELYISEAPTQCCSLD